MTSNEVVLITELINKVDAKADGIDAKVDVVAGKVDDLLAFKWQVFGGTVVVSLIVGTIVSVIVAIVGRG